MTTKFPEFGNKVIATVLEADYCTIGMQVGDEFELSSHKCGDFCGSFYHDIYPWVTLLQFDGFLGEGIDSQTYSCSRGVKIELKRIKE